MEHSIKLIRPKRLHHWISIYRLYMDAFPVSERKPFSMIVRMFRNGKTDVWYCTDHGTFIGLAITINGEDVILLDYFAIIKNSRGSGFGSAVLQELIRHYEPRGLFGEIESTYENCPDRVMRIRRKQFYLDNGLREMGVMVKLFGVNMELLTTGKQLTFDQYRSFYRDNYSTWAAEHILPPDQ